MVSQKLKILIYGSAMWALAEGMLGPLFAVFTQRIGGDIFDITWAWATYLLIMGIVVIVIGKISDVKKRKVKIMVFGYGLNALFTFGYLFVRSPIHLFIIQAGLGIATAMTAPTWASLYSLHGNQKQKCYEWGLVDGIAHILEAAGIIIGGFIVAYLGFNVLFITMGTIQTISTIYQLKLLRK